MNTDPCAYQVGAALFQTQENGERKPLGFWPRTLILAEQNYSATEKECLAIVFGIQVCRTYLQEKKFTVYTGRNALRCLFEITEPSERLMRWRLQLCEFNFEIRYGKAKSNCQADAM